MKKPFLNFGLEVEPLKPPSSTHVFLRVYRVLYVYGFVANIIYYNIVWWASHLFIIRWLFIFCCAFLYTSTSACTLIVVNSSVYSRAIRF